VVAIKQQTVWQTLLVELKGTEATDRLGADKTKAVTLGTSGASGPPIMRPRHNDSQCLLITGWCSM